MRGNVLVPVGPIQEVVQEWVSRTGSNVNELSAKTGVPERSLARINTQEQVSFSIADALITNTVGPMAWWTDDRLSEIYISLDFRNEDLVNPIQSPGPIAEAERKIIKAWDKYQSLGKAAESLGMNSTSYSSRLNKILRRNNAGKTNCIHGHSYAVVGRLKDGTCRACKAIYQRGKHVNKSGKTRKKRVEI